MFRRIVFRFVVFFHKYENLLWCHIFSWCWLHGLLIFLRGGQLISSELNGVTGFFPTFKRGACQNHLLVVSCRSAPFVFDGKGITSNLMTYLFILQDFISKLFWKFYWEKQNIHVLPSTAKLIIVKVSYFEVWWILHEDHIVVLIEVALCTKMDSVQIFGIIWCIIWSIICISFLVEDEECGKSYLKLLNNLFNSLNLPAPIPDEERKWT